MNKFNTTLNKFQLMIKALLSTKKFTSITEELFGTKFSASNVSELCKRLYPI